MQILAAVERALLLLLFDHVEAVRIALVGPLVEFLLPRGLLRGDLVGAGGTRGIAREGALGQTLRQRNGGSLRIAADTDRDLLHEAEHLVIGIDLMIFAFFGQ